MGNYELKVWAAGLFEGEGSATIQIGGSSYEAHCSIVNTDPELVRIIHAQWEGNVVIVPASYHQDRYRDHRVYRDSYKVVFNYSEAVRFLSDIMPYMKGRKAEEVGVFIHAVQTGNLEGGFEALNQLRKDGFNEPAVSELRSVARIYCSSKASLSDSDFQRVITSCLGYEEELLIRILTETKFNSRNLLGLRVKDVMSGTVVLNGREFKLSEDVMAALQGHIREKDEPEKVFPSFGHYPRQQAGWYLWFKIKQIGFRSDLELTPIMLKGSRVEL